MRKTTVKKMTGSLLHALPVLNCIKCFENLQVISKRFFLYYTADCSKYTSPIRLAVSRIQTKSMSSFSHMDYTGTQKSACIVR